VTRPHERRSSLEEGQAEMARMKAELQAEQVCERKGGVGAVWCFCFRGLVDRHAWRCAKGLAIGKQQI